jgi:hypothetical protein
MKNSYLCYTQTENPEIWKVFDISLIKAAIHNSNSYSGPLVLAARQIKNQTEIYVPGFPRENDYFPPKTLFDTLDINSSLTKFYNSIKTE